MNARNWARTVAVWAFCATLAAGCGDIEVAAGSDAEGVGGDGSEPTLLVSFGDSSQDRMDGRRVSLSVSDLQVPQEGYVWVLWLTAAPPLETPLRVGVLERARDTSLSYVAENDVGNLLARYHVAVLSLEAESALAGLTTYTNETYRGAREEPVWEHIRHLAVADAEGNPPGMVRRLHALCDEIHNHATRGREAQGTGDFGVVEESAEAVHNLVRGGASAEDLTGDGEIRLPGSDRTGVVGSTGCYLEQIEELVSLADAAAEEVEDDDYWDNTSAVYALEESLWGTADAVTEAASLLVDDSQNATHATDLLERTEELGYLAYDLYQATLGLATVRLEAGE